MQVEDTLLLAERLTTGRFIGELRQRILAAEIGQTPVIANADLRGICVTASSGHEFWSAGAIIKGIYVRAADDCRAAIVFQTGTPPRIIIDAYEPPVMAP